MKTGVSDQQAGSFLPRRRAGMTLIEVLLSLLIAVLLVVSIVRGYIYCMSSALKAELAQEANAQAFQRLEEARSTTWNTSSSAAQDQLVASNFPNEVVTLDMPGTNAVGTTATILTTITQVSTVPPLR